MALKSPLMPSPNGNLSSAFSPYSDSPNSPAVPGAFNGLEKRYAHLVAVTKAHAEGYLQIVWPL